MPLDTLSTRTSVRLASVLLALTVAMSACGDRPDEPVPADEIGGELNILVMPGYEEEQIIRPFEEEFGVTVNSRNYPSSDEMFAIVSAARPGEWDIITPDTPWVERLVRADLIEPLDRADYPAIEDFYEHWRDFEQVFVDDQLYSIVSRWGYYGIVYNSDHVDEEVVQSTEGMWHPDYSGRVVLFDWYLPNMGMLARYLGHDQPYDIDSPDVLAEIEEVLLSLRPHVGAIAATNADTIQALATGEAWLSFGGEWLQLLLKEEGHPIEVHVPDEGGVSWTESLSIMKGSQNPEAARAFVQYMLRPETQAMLAWADAFHAYVPNAEAADHLHEEARAALGLDQAGAAEDILANIATRKIPPNEDAWQEIWERFKDA
jgi:spermidine/putrescine transport system substrate-binding protein